MFKKTAALLAALLTFTASTIMAYDICDLQEDVESSGYLMTNGIYRMDPDTPEQKPTYEMKLNLAADLADWGAAKLSFRVAHDGTVHHPSSDNIFMEYNKVFQDKRQYIDIDEAYMDVYLDSADLRFGIQKFAWGRIDGLSPVDNLNTINSMRGPLSGEMDAKIGVPAFKANIFSDWFNTELAWIPVVIPARLPTYEERWFPTMMRLPSHIDSGPMGLIPMLTTYQDIDMPAITLANSELGVRFSKYIGGWDLALSYYNGFDPQPSFDSPTDIIVTLKDPLAFDTDTFVVGYANPVLARMQVLGLDFSTTAGPCTIRGELAYLHKKRFNRLMDDIIDEMMTPQFQQDILDEFFRRYIDSGGTAFRQSFRVVPDVGVKYNVMEYGLGLDYLVGDTMLSVQVIQERILNYNQSKRVNFNKRGQDTNITANITSMFVQNTLELSLTGLINIEYESLVLSPSITYAFTDSLKGTAGYLLINGKDKDSLIGQFRDNDQFYAIMKYSF